MTDHDWTVRLDSAFASTARDIWAGALFFGTNWPVDSLWSGYADGGRAYTTFISDFSADEREGLFVKNAERLYRI